MKPKSENTVIFEGIVSVSALIKATELGISRRRILRVLIEESKLKSERHKTGFIKAASRRFGFITEVITQNEAAELATGKTHGGFFAEATAAVYPGKDTLTPSNYRFAAILDGTEDPYSLGHSARVLYSCGCDALILPRLPEMADTVVCRASAGAFELLPVFVCDSADAVSAFRASGVKTVCAGIRDSVPIRDADLSFPLILVCGGEKRGISSSVLEQSDLTVRIPYSREFLGSLPSETAVSIFAYEIMSQNS